MKSSGEVKLFVGILVVATILVGFTLWQAKQSELPPPPAVPDSQPTTADQKKLAPPDLPVLGDKNAPATLVEFGDFLCPQCRLAADFVRTDIAQRNKGRIKYVFRHFRAASEHEGEPTLARAAEAAGMQGRFWDMFDALFKEQDAMQKLPVVAVRTRCIEIAKRLGLNEAKFTADLDGAATGARFDTDMALGADLRITSTPTFFLFVPNKPTMKMLSLAKLEEWLNDPSHL